MGGGALVEASIRPGLDDLGHAHGFQLVTGLLMTWAREDQGGHTEILGAPGCSRYPAHAGPSALDLAEMMSSGAASSTLSVPCMHVCISCRKVQNNESIIMQLLV